MRWRSLVRAHRPNSRSEAIPRTSPPRYQVVDGEEVLATQVESTSIKAAWKQAWLYLEWQRRLRDRIQA